jgi:hypothetical protein
VTRNGDDFLASAAIDPWLGDMYAGHVAIALALKARDPRIPIVPLALACFGPDWIELVLLASGARQGTAIYSHSIPAVLVGAGLASGIFAALKRPGARWILIGWLSHWPADLFTGRKPLFTPLPLVGLDLYKLPPVDFVLESIVIIFACELYARRYARRAELRRPIVMLGAALMLLQGAVDVALSVMRNSEWSPSLALAPRPGQLTCRPPLRAGPGSACLLHFSARTSTASDLWRRTGPEV